MKLTPAKEQAISIAIIISSVLVFGGFAVYFFFFYNTAANVNLRTEFMPNIVGYSYKDVEMCYNKFFQMEIEAQQYSDVYASGIILSQDIPEATAYAFGETKVRVTVSLGKPTAIEQAPVVVETQPKPVVTETITEKIISEVKIVNPKAPFENYIADGSLEISTIGIDNENQEINNILSELQKYLQKKGIDSGYLYYDIKTGASIEYNANERFSAGSVIKAPFIRSVLTKELDLNRKFEMTEGMLNSKTELINNEPVGTLFSLEELVKAVLINSDNTAYKMLYKQVGYEAFNELSESLNITHRMTNDNYWFRLTPRQTAIYFKDIYYFTEQHPNGKLIKESMSEATYDMIAHELSEYNVAEKYGYMPQEDFYTLSDGAIVYAKSPYILIGYVRGNGTVLNTMFFNEIARMTDNIHRIIHEDDN